MNEEEKYLKAKEKVENLKAFYIHLTAFICVNLGLLILNLLTYDGQWWSVYPLGGWGVGLLVHGIVTFATNNFGDDWEARKIKKYMDKN